MPFRSFLLFGLLLLPPLSLRAEDAQGGPHTYKIGPSTQIMLDGHGAPASDLKVGLHAAVSADSFQDGYAAKIDAHSLSAKGGKPAKAAAAAPAATGAKAAAPAAKPASGAKFWTINAVSADSITVEYK